MEFDDTSGALFVAMDGDLVVVDPTTGGSTVLGPTPVVQALEVVGTCDPTPPPAPPVPALTAGGRVALAAGLAVAALLAGRVRSRRRAAGA